MLLVVQWRNLAVDTIGAAHLRRWLARGRIDSECAYPATKYMMDELTQRALSFGRHLGVHRGGRSIVA